MSDTTPAAPAEQPQPAGFFARPSGVSGAFAPRKPNEVPPLPSRQLPPTQDAARAFGKPIGADNSGLQRPPGSDKADSADDDPVFWVPDADKDSWRDPGAPALLGPPLPADNAASSDTTTRPASPLLSITELLFGRKVAPLALTALAGVALLIGLVGGIVGWSLAQSGNPLADAGVTLSQVDRGIERASGSVADIAKRVQPAVVSIEVQSGQTGAIGSGVVIDGAGYILTNNHVVSLAASDSKAQLRAVFSDGTKAEAKIVGRDPKTDLAVIKVSVSNPTVMTLGRSDSLAVGDQVIAIGSPLGLAGTVTSGIVSALHRPVTAAGDAGEPPVSYDAIQTDAAINHGNSGGALVDATGALVGINSAIASASSASGQDSGSIGIGFAIPIDFAKKIAEGLIHDGQVKHADLGANTKSVSAVTTDGAQVQNVKLGGAANKAGIVEGDVIVKFGDRSIGNAEDLAVVVIEHNIGETVPVQLVRQGRTLTISVTLQSD